MFQITRPHILIETNDYV